MVPSLFEFILHLATGKVIITTIPFAQTPIIETFITNVPALNPSSFSKVVEMNRYTAS